MRFKRDAKSKVTASPRGTNAFRNGKVFEVYLSVLQLPSHFYFYLVLQVCAFKRHPQYPRNPLTVSGLSPNLNVACELWYPTRSTKPLNPSREAGKETAMPGSTVPTSGANQGRNLTAAPHSATPQSTLEDATTVGRTILSEDEIRRALTRIAYEIIETNKGVENLVLIGIRSRGVPLAVRLAARIQAIEPNFNAETRIGALDITAYRDDQRTGGTTSLETAGESIMPSIGIEGKTVVLVDDVLYSGRTVRAALDALNAHGRPALVRLAVLVDRGHRQLPIRADHVGKNLPTSASETVRVVLTETDNATDRVDIIQLGGLS